MSPAVRFGEQVDRPAERALFQALFDDAVLFPPAPASLTKAVANHGARKDSSSADLTGPLLLPVSMVEDFLHCDRPQHLNVALIGRPVTDPAQVSDALSRCEQDRGVTLAGVEIEWSPQWHQALGWDVSLSIEVPRGAGRDRALSELQKHADGPHLVQATLSTGSIPTSPAPTPAQLAAFIRACVDHDLGFKLTDGVHPAITAATSAGEDQSGFLNIIAATRWALSHAAEVPELDAILSQRDPAPILDIITRMSGADASVLRAFFTAYGCFEVVDPIRDLAAFGLITQTTV